MFGQVSTRLALSRLGQTCNQRYLSFKIPKRKGGARTIHKPAPDLMLLQRLIKRKILDNAPTPPDCVTAFRPGTSILDNAMALSNIEVPGRNAVTQSGGVGALSRIFLLIRRCRSIRSGAGLWIVRAPPFLFGILKLR